MSSAVYFFFLFFHLHFFLIHFITLFGKFGPSYLRKATAASRAALTQSYKCICWVFSCFRNPPNSDIDYRIFNVRTWSLLCVRIHAGVLDTSAAIQHNIFDSEKLSQIFLVLMMGFEPRVFVSRVRRSPTESGHPATPTRLVGVDRNNVNYPLPWKCV